MPRSERLLQLLDLLRQRRRAITAELLAEKLDVSVRTVYRDIESLRNRGADIRGETGIGFMLYHDFLLPPLMFSQDEIESLVLGVRWVMKNGDTELADKAHSALSKINTVLPEALVKQIRQNALHPVMKPPKDTGDSETLIMVRIALREERKLNFDYRDKESNLSHRSVYPINIAYFESVRVITAWCELRENFRYFRTDRISCLSIGENYQPARAALERQWQEKENIKLQQLDL